MKPKRKILAVSGARSDYDLMFTIYEKLHLTKNVDFSIVITGPHLSEKFGLTGELVEKDGFKISEKIYNLLDSNEKLARVASIGHQIPLFAQTLAREKPDLVLVAGDREEAITVALTCAYMNIAVAHFFGGDIAKDGNIDNSVRYACSKFAHIHFTTLSEHKNNLIRMGEDHWRVHVIGNPALDRFLSIPKLSKKDTLSRIDFKTTSYHDYCVLIQHSVITEVERQAEYIRITLEAIKESGIFCFINFPNSDAGSHEIISAYEEYSMLYPNQFKLFKNLERLFYVNLLRHASFLIGNSSSGLLEAPSLGLAAINVGSRQRGRVHGDNIVFVDNDKEELKKAINYVQNDESFIKKLKLTKNPYGDGNSSEKAVEILTKIDISHKLLFKNITY